MTVNHPEKKTIARVGRAKNFHILLSTRFHCSPSQAHGVWRTPFPPGQKELIMTSDYEENDYRTEDYGNPRMKKRGGGAPILGFMIGGLIGAASMLLFAPQSGKETRQAVKEGANDLKDRANDTAQRTVSQARSKAQDIASTAREKASDLQNRSMNAAADQLDRVAKAAQSGKKAIKSQQNNSSNTSYNNPSTY
jgi:gas vesicle protein